MVDAHPEQPPVRSLVLRLILSRKGCFWLANAQTSIKYLQVIQLKPIFNIQSHGFAHVFSPNPTSSESMNYLAVLVHSMSSSSAEDAAPYFLHVKKYHSIRYFVPQSNCSIKVQAASTGDGYEPDRLRACTAFAKLRGSKQQTVTMEAAPASRAYTYVALWFEHLHFVRFTSAQTQRIFTRYPHHVTLAYLPAMCERERKRIEDGLNGLLISWWSGDWLSRPYALLSFRKFLEGRHKSDWPKNLHPTYPYDFSTLNRWPGLDGVYTFRDTSGVLDHWAYLEKLIRQDLLRFATPPREWKQELSPAQKKELFYSYVSRDRMCFFV